MKLSIPDTTIVMQGTELTDDDRLALTELTQSRGWQVFKSKVCSARLEVLERDALSLTDFLDIRYRQGGYQEIWGVLRNAEELSKKEKSDPLREVVEDDFGWHGHNV